MVSGVAHLACHSDLVATSSPAVGCRRVLTRRRREEPPGAPVTRCLAWRVLGGISRMAVIREVLEVIPSHPSLRAAEAVLSRPSQGSVCPPTQEGAYD